jgi:mannose-6-phosphate isomerase-like protein (cupin superfamily)
MEVAMTKLVPPNRFTDVEGSSPDDPAISSRSQSQEVIQPASYPYETRLNVLHGPLELVDVNALAAACDHTWFNQTLCKVNNSVVRVGVIEGEYHWHKNDHDDEFFYVVEGHLLIDLESHTVELSPGQGMVVPRATVHRARAPQRTIILMVENSGIIPTGN